MATAQLGLSGRELMSRMSLLAADPKERFGSKSPPSSPLSYVSSEATEPVSDTLPDPVPWDVVQRQHEQWMASVGSMVGSMDRFKPVAEHLRKQKEQEEQEFTRRTGIPIVQRTMIPVSYDLDGVPTQPARRPTKPAPANVDIVVAKARVPLRRSARIAQNPKRREQTSPAPQKASQPSRQRPAPGRPRGRPPKRPVPQEKRSPGGIAKKRGRPSTRRSQQEGKSQGGITNKRGQTRKILALEEGIAKKTGRPKKISPHR